MNREAGTAFDEWAGPVSRLEGADAGAVTANAAAVRTIVQCCRAIVFGYLVIESLKLGLLPGRGALNAMLAMFGVAIVAVFVFLLPWQRWIKTPLGAQRLAWSLAMVPAVTLPISTWVTGMQSWWVLPLLMVIGAPALVSLELYERGNRSPWALSRAQGLVLLAWGG